MAKKRYINTRIWADNYFSNLDPIEKLLFIYFLTNSFTDICGIYELPLKQMALDTGIDREDMLPSIIKRFERDDKIYYFDGWVYIKNFIRHQAVNDSVILGIKRSLSDVPVRIIAYIKEIDPDWVQSIPRLGTDCGLPTLTPTPTPTPIPIHEDSNFESSRKAKNPEEDTTDAERLLAYANGEIDSLSEKYTQDGDSLYQKFGERFNKLRKMKVGSKAHTVDNATITAQVSNAVKEHFSNNEFEIEKYIDWLVQKGKKEGWFPRVTSYRLLTKHLTEYLPYEKPQKSFADQPKQTVQEVLRDKDFYDKIDEKRRERLLKRQAEIDAANLIETD